jgi:hypothetical protein
VLHVIIFCLQETITLLKHNLNDTFTQLASSNGQDNQLQQMHQLLMMNMMSKMMPQQDELRKVQKSIDNLAQIVSEQAETTKKLTEAVIAMVSMKRRRDSDEDI